MSGCYYLKHSLCSVPIYNTLGNQKILLISITYYYVVVGYRTCNSYLILAWLQPKPKPRPIPHSPDLLTTLMCHHPTHLKDLLAVLWLQREGLSQMCLSISDVSLMPLIIRLTRRSIIF